MPPYTRGQQRDVLTFVAITDNILYYGFPTKDFAGISGLGITQGDLTALGHLQPATVPTNGIRIIAASSPKPPRMKKVVNARPTATQQGNTSTFCGVNSVRTAEEQGWKFVKSGRSVTVSNNNRTWTMGASLEDGGLYIFPMNPVDADAFAEILGLQRPAQISSEERRRAFSGTSRPRPTKMKYRLPNGETVNAFCSSRYVDNALSNNWEITKPEVRYQ